MEHKLDMKGPTGNLSAWVCRCSCGGWEAKMPDVGSYGNTSAKARIAQAKMAFEKHAKHARRPPPNQVKE